MSSWALLVCAILNTSAKWVTIEKKELRREGKWICSFFYSLFPNSLSTSLCLMGITCLSLTVCLISTCQYSLEKKRINEIWIPKPPNKTHLAGFDCCLHFSASNLKTDSLPRGCGSYKGGRKNLLQWWLYNDSESIAGGYLLFELIHTCHLKVTMMKQAALWSGHLLPGHSC